MLSAIGVSLNTPMAPLVVFMDPRLLDSILGIIIGSAEGAFLQVTVFVGAVLLFFGYINFRSHGKFIRTIQERKQWQPVIGAFLGLTPGCGGAIFIMPLYLKGSVTFGTVVATLIATAGDSAFVVISKLPLHFVVISLLSLIAAILTGYVVDYYGVGEHLIQAREKKSEQELERMHQKADHMLQNVECATITGGQSDLITHIGHEEGDEVDLIMHHTVKGHQRLDTLGYWVTHKGSGFYWAFITIGLVLGIMLLFQAGVNQLRIPKLVTAIGVTGTAFSIVLMVMGEKFLADDTLEEAELKLMSLKETLIHNAQETAFVGTWVFVAYLLYGSVILLMGEGDYARGELLAQGLMTSAGLAAVVVGVLIGLIPGCGPQIIFVTLFVKGWLPFSALVANAISQDGDALFPLIAMDKRSALWATVITTVPALIFGVSLYYLEISWIGDTFRVAVDSLVTMFFG